jgi:hypothetical protein
VEDGGRLLELATPAHLPCRPGPVTIQTIMIRSLLPVLLVALAIAAPAFAWGPLMHAALGREGARAAGLDARACELAASGAFLADLDHTFKDAPVVGDSVAFARALVQVKGCSSDSDLWARGWLAHVLAQDPGQGRIADRGLKLHADYILLEQSGYALAGVVYDPERIRKAARALGAKAPDAGAIRRAVEKFLLYGILEQALLDGIPLELDASSTGPGNSRRDGIPEFSDLVPSAWRSSPESLPAARSLMPAELGDFERCREASLKATMEVFKAPPTPTALARERTRSTGFREHVISHVPVSPARAIGLDLVSSATKSGLMRTTATIWSVWLFRPAALPMLRFVGHSMFPTVYQRWNARDSVAKRTPLLQQHLRDEAARLKKQFP